MPPKTRHPLLRPDTKRPKEMGWFESTSERTLMHLANLQTSPPNESYRGMTVGAAMGRRSANARVRERTKSACLQAKIPLGIPKSVTLTRLSAGELDDDAVVAALKFARDGVALALGFDDRRFSICGMDQNRIPIFYRQAKCPQLYYAVEIEIVHNTIMEEVNSVDVHLF